MGLMSQNIPFLSLSMSSNELRPCVPTRAHDVILIVEGGYEIKMMSSCALGLNNDFIWSHCFPLGPLPLNRLT